MHIYYKTHSYVSNIYKKSHELRNQSSIHEIYFLIYVEIIVYKIPLTASLYNCVYDLAI